MEKNRKRRWGATVTPGTRSITPRGTASAYLDAHPVEGTFVPDRLGEAMPSFSRLALALASVAFVSLSAAGCAQADDADVEQGEDQLQKGPNSDRWVYNGKLPHLESPSIIVAQTTHTVRVTGFLPEGFDAAELPFFAKDGATQEGGRTRVSVVYPIATGSSVNHQPDDYVTERVFPRRTDSSAPWGGFPFISYVNDDSPFKGIAFHGPITASDGEWKLVRGPVSHGCNRMQGEHVVELAHLIGVDMTGKLWSGDTILRDLKIPVKVIRKTPDTFNGQNVDVDYPAQPSVKRPTENVKMFKAWRSQDFPTWVCKVAKNAPPANAVPADYCSKTLGLKDKFDAVAGPS
jgi:hypothetical protein